jgi:hypothetical protein
MAISWSLGAQKTSTQAIGKVEINGGTYKALEVGNDGISLLKNNSLLLPSWIK